MTNTESIKHCELMIQHYEKAIAQAQKELKGWYLYLGYLRAPQNIKDMVDVSLGHKKAVPK